MSLGVPIYAKHVKANINADIVEKIRGSRIIDMHRDKRSVVEKKQRYGEIVQSINKKIPGLTLLPEALDIVIKAIEQDNSKTKKPMHLRITSFIPDSAS